MDGGEKGIEGKMEGGGLVRDGGGVENTGEVGVAWFTLQLLELSGPLLSIHIPYRERSVSLSALVERESAGEGVCDVHMYAQAHAASEG